VAALALVEVGQEYVETGWFEKAFDAITSAKQLYPELIFDPHREIERLATASSYVWRGKRFYSSDDFELAIDSFNQAIELDPTVFEAYKGRADAHYVQGNYQLAIADYTSVLAAESDSATLYHRRGSAYYRMEDYAAAIVDFQHAISLEPNNAAYHNSLCWFGTLAGFATSVLDVCNQAVELADDDRIAGIHDSRGLARALTGDVAGAIEDFEFALERAGRDGLGDDFFESRTAWVNALREGQEPAELFDDSTLEALKNE
jgi:tetratricopeptide (TPR) repeat protein